MTASEKQPFVLLTGCSGLLGSAVIERLSKDFFIVGLDVDPPEQEHDRFAFYTVDLASKQSVDRTLDNIGQRFGHDIISVIHLAAYYDFSGEPSPLYEEVTVVGTCRLVESLKPFNVSQFIFSSTMLVHEPTEIGKPITEDAPVDPTWPYPQSKWKTEQRLREIRGDMPTVCLRIAGVYDDVCHSIPLSNQIQRIYEERMTSRVYPGDVDHGQAFVHLDDVVDAIVRCVVRRTELPDELNLLIGEPETPGYQDIQHALGQFLHQKPWPTQQIPKAIAKAGAWVKDNVPIGEEPFIKPWMVDRADDHYELDITRARETIGWSPRQRVLPTLEKMVDMMRKDTIAWYAEHDLEPHTESAGASEDR